MQTTTLQPAELKVRKMRVCNHYFARKTSMGAVFPVVRLCGRWLKNSGFKAGQYIHIAHGHQKILITVVPDEIINENTKRNEKGKTKKATS